MSDEGANLSARGEEFLHAVRRGMEFTRELLGENERLRRRLADLEEGQQRYRERLRPRFVQPWSNHKRGVRRHQGNRRTRAGDAPGRSCRPESGKARAEDQDPG